ncbi:MAG: ATP-binding cassette domain-containing protein [Candidatus Latescibacteria bacterium]|nr:ATP-binding cassette domain-containing protein [Candidatus Latescibacterota bacterium]
MSFIPFRPLLPYLAPYKRRITIGLVWLLAVQAIAISMPMVLKWTIDTLEGGIHNPSNRAYYSGSIEGDMAIFAGLIAGLALLEWLMSIAMRWQFGAMSRLVEGDIRKRYIRHLLKLPLAFFQGERTGDLVARATNDVEAIQRFLYFGLRMGITGLLTFVLSLALMCSIDWQLALLALLPMPVMVLITRWVGSRVRRGFARVQEQFGAMSTQVQENLAGMRVVKAFALADDEIARFTQTNQAYVDENRRLIKLRSLFFPFTFLVNGVSMVVILWLGGLRVIEGSFTLGAFVAFNAYLTRLGMPMMLLGWIVDEYQRCRASLGRLEEIFAAAPQADLGTALPAAKTPIRGAIEFRHTHFSYDDQAVLEDINIRVPAGTTLAVVGRVGSGKTTIARLLPSLIRAGAGQVLIDGTPIEDIPVKHLRQAIGYVPQESFLFSDSLRENIALGQSGEAADKAAQIARLTPDLEDFPLAMETVVGERGTTLSGGQKQRTALARAIVRDPQILILDDALASVDARTEQEILAGLNQLMAQRTTVLIAHRISTVQHADHIVVLDQGRIAEEGTHDSLLELDGIYADMHRRQNITRELSAL